VPHAFADARCSCACSGRATRVQRTCCSDHVLQRTYSAEDIFVCRYVLCRICSHTEDIFCRGHIVVETDHLRLYYLPLYYLPLYYLPLYYLPLYYLTLYYLPLYYLPLYYLPLYYLPLYYLHREVVETDHGLAGDFYRSCMNMTAINAMGNRPIQVCMSVLYVCMYTYVCRHHAGLPLDVHVYMTTL